jgi:hypothetical protein
MTIELAKHNREEFLADCKSKFEEDKLNWKKLYEDTISKDDYESLDDDGYPTDDALFLIENWHWSDSKGWFEFIKSIWWARDWGWTEGEEPHDWDENKKVYRYNISTGGWSGNENIIRAMEKNGGGFFWHLNWVQSRRGGHYIFERKDFDDEEDSGNG